MIRFYTTEQKGIATLVILIVCLFILPRQFLHRENNFFILTEIDQPPIDTTPPEIVRKQITNKFVQAIKPIELNRADSSALVQIRGIGPYYATKIIRYRERLGGYNNIRQLKELKMTYFNVDSMAHLFTIDSSFIIKKDLDSMTFKEVLRHPYLEYEDVKLIFNTKNKNKKISYSILKEQKILPDYLLNRIHPYFK